MYKSKSLAYHGFQLWITKCNSVPIHLHITFDVLHHMLSHTKT
ncbi:hypothetical protein HanXRQr2_Chr05g0196761 [Helianthus annuus]|uniref:Uncharacterized protein n=1 Tax=Helianthus annuus TaxID=4232 RepID=A0A9K3IX92_HELAN|nr:hypothetical protein HanXRQr2_Chr05g0196761 [Helianthus annuus]